MNEKKLVGINNITTAVNPPMKDDMPIATNNVATNTNLDEADSNTSNEIVATENNSESGSLTDETIDMEPTFDENMGFDDSVMSGDLTNNGGGGLSNTAILSIVIGVCVVLGIVLGIILGKKAAKK